MRRVIQLLLIRGYGFSGRDNGRHFIDGIAGPTLIFENQVFQGGGRPTLQVGIPRGRCVIQHVPNGTRYVQTIFDGTKVVFVTFGLC